MELCSVKYRLHTQRYVTCPRYVCVDICIINKFDTDLDEVSVWYSIYGSRIMSPYFGAPVYGIQKYILGYSQANKQTDF